MVSLSTLAYTATGQLTDGSSQDLSSQASWSSSFPSVASIDSIGQVTTLASGQTTLTAVFSGLSATAVLTVTGGNLTTINIGPTLTKRLVNGTSGLVWGNRNFRQWQLAGYYRAGHLGLLRSDCRYNQQPLCSQGPDDDRRSRNKHTDGDL